MRDALGDHVHQALLMMIRWVDLFKLLLFLFLCILLAVVFVLLYFKLFVLLPGQVLLRCFVLS